MTLLSTPLSLHDVLNAEARMKSELDLRLKERGAHLTHHEYEDAHSYFIERAWELSLTYDPSRGWSFSKLCRDRSRYWYVDWLRQRFEQSRYGGRVVTEELRDEDKPYVEWPEVLATINTALLSPLARRTLTTIAFPHHVEGRPLSLIASEQGRPQKELKDLLSNLEQELEVRCLAA